VRWVRVLDMQVTLHDKRIVMQVTLHYEAIVIKKWINKIPPLPNYQSWTHENSSNGNLEYNNIFNMNIMPCGRKNDVKARTTLLLSLPDEHQLRFSKFKTSQELWAAILKTFDGNEATKKTKKNLLKQQYGNFKAEGSETLEQTFNRLQVIINQLEFMDIEIKQDDLNQKFLTSLTPEWLMHMIVWRNRSDLDTMSLDDLYNHLKVYEFEVQKKSKSNSQNMAFISSVKHKSGNEEVNIASVSTASTNVSTASANIGVASISQDTAYDMEEMDIKWNMPLLSMRADRAPRSQDRGRTDNYRQGSKVEEQAPKALMAIDGVGYEWIYMANDEENHALIADEETPTKFALMAKTSAESEIGLPEFKDDTITNYSRPLPTIESTSDNSQNRNPYVTETEASPSTISPKPFIKFVKATDRSIETKTAKVKTCKPAVKYAVMYSKPSKSSKKRACYNYGDFDHLAYDCCKRVDHGRSWAKNNNTHKSMSPRPAIHRPYRPSIRPVRPNMNVAQPKRTSFHKPALSYNKRPFKRTTTVRSQFRDPRVSTVNRKFPTVNRKLPTINRKFPTGNTKSSTADMGNKGKAVKASACNISYLSDYEPFNGGYVSFGQGGCKITGKGTIKIGKLEFESVYFVKDLKDFKLLEDANVLLRTPRSPAIGFLIPFGCHVMILNTLDHLGKFEAKGDEDYFIGYSMSSKAFRVFNKRTKRVEENLHVEFLENKAIEKGAGPNWLFDIDSLTKYMNYVPLVAGINSTNLSGTKDAVSQEVKKDVSSLRYIALPNWDHDALLESSSSKPQDDYSADVPESSRNLNPTATSTNPSTDQMETLTVETPIPTVSSPVPTACFTDSQEPLSDTKLISKRVANQVETQSLDNILTLTNRFEDILRVTTNSDESNGVEADMDVKSAFLYGTIDDEVYVMQPLGFQDPEFPARVYKVEKAMYGLHQAPRA
nr:hypothetical protein [Tanacetum cinerariifolium]